MKIGLHAVNNVFSAGTMLNLLVIMHDAHNINNTNPRHFFLSHTLPRT
jgi:hypothetical protein